ncbi:hypothetical protein DUNSADRAFT_14833 [Dunaliella salina]|uniref:Uncharacterized protein n=1 Tax=Dunaliella salina TaxID=3046 RepID=A0ABQ7H289_DUNSA|nr:hypothetical protein DUNSADRAFT_14833 [Dunaliella salina]|eukprot:KAF5840977.1 hypothetical protein DUNSADRAFT_14833 [Dunaliella salina]
MGTGHGQCRWRHTWCIGTSEARLSRRRVRRSAKASMPRREHGAGDAGVGRAARHSIWHPLHRPDRTRGPQPGHCCFQAHGCGGKAPDCNQAGAGHPLGDVRWS